MASSLCVGDEAEDSPSCSLVAVLSFEMLGSVVDKSVKLAAEESAAGRGFSYYPLLPTDMLMMSEHESALRTRDGATLIPAEQNLADR